MYPGRKDTIKACIYVKELVRFMLYRLEHHDSGVELYNCCYEPAYTIEHIVESMKRVTNMKVKVPFMPGWLIMTAAGIAGALGSPMGICPARVRKLQISTNICAGYDSGRKLFTRPLLPSVLDLLITAGILSCITLIGFFFLAAGLCAL